jgi:hypothetical protein
LLFALLPTAEDIEQWADSLLAPEDLPRLVRKLIVATTEPTHLDIGAGKTVRLKGRATLTPTLAILPLAWNRWRPRAPLPPRKLTPDLTPAGGTLVMASKASPMRTMLATSGIRSPLRPPG